MVPFAQPALPPLLGHPCSGLCSGNTNPGERERSLEPPRGPAPLRVPPTPPPSGAGASARGPGKAPDRSLRLHPGGFSPFCCGPGESPLGAVGMGTGTSRPRRGSAPASRERREGKLFLEQELFWEGSVLLSQPGQNSKGNCTRAPPHRRMLIFLSPKSFDPTMGQQTPELAAPLAPRQLGGGGTCPLLSLSGFLRGLAAPQVTPGWFCKREAPQAQPPGAEAEAGGGAGWSTAPELAEKGQKCFSPRQGARPRRRWPRDVPAPGQRGRVPPPAGQRGTAPRRTRAPVFKAALGPLGMPRVSQAGRRHGRRWLPIPAAAPGWPLPKRTGLAQPPRKDRGEKLCHSHEFMSIFGGLPGALPTLQAKAGGGPARGQRHGAALGRASRLRAAAVLGAGSAQVAWTQPQARQG